VRRRDVYEALLLTFLEGQRELAEHLLGDRHARDRELEEEREDWWDQWERADVDVDTVLRGT
jgi:hypothetical protein